MCRPPLAHARARSPRIKQNDVAPPPRRRAPTGPTQDNAQGDMHENAMEKLIHTDFFNNFKDDFDDTELD